MPEPFGAVLFAIATIAKRAGLRSKKAVTIYSLVLGGILPA
jgi:hypothetical protein